ncbi:DUF4383 domain-containing protein [Streptomyces sp. NPDC005480]|jgi:prepilin signal peptidase PulO-like enzyme (type II secretory pathway)|uniref:DUF4383 domain-containing protein n=1 Tax=Streptomyces sp. NPDC005480 TaxID=3154880 RepID=UPI00339E7CFF
MATHVPEVRPAPRLRHPRVVLDDHLPVDHGLSKVYRIGAGLMGLVLVAFGILGLIDQIGFFDTGGDKVAGLNTNGALSVLSILIGALLFAGMVIGRNVASTINMTVGVLFIISGFVNLALLQTDYNFLAFEIQNVLFSFVVGVMLMAFGMYGRVSGTLPHDNPYWRARHPESAAREDRARAARQPHPTLEATKAPGVATAPGATETTKVTDGPGPPRIIDK